MMNTQKFVTSSIIFIIMLIASGCLRPSHSYRKPDVILPDEWKAKEEIDDDNSENAQLSFWWEAFDDPLLDDMIQLSFKNNPDLAIACYKILEQRADYFRTKANLYPSVYLGAGHAGVLLPSQGVFLGQQNFINLLKTQNVQIERHLAFYHFGPSVSWEIDIFGRIRSAAYAEEAEYQGKVENLKAVQLALSADVARNYIDLRSFQAKLKIEENYQQILLNRLDLLQKRSSIRLAFLDNIVDTQHLLFETKARIGLLNKSINETTQRLYSLLGIMDDSLDLSVASCISVPKPKTSIDAGVPSNLLSQRPDIMQAEKELAAATYRVRSKKAEALPSFVLVGTIGGISKHILNMLSYKQLYGLVDPFISMPIYDGGRIRASIAEHQAKADAAFARYHKTLLNAVEEVQIALYALNYQKERMEIRTDLCHTAANSLNRHQLLYEQAFSDYIAMSKAEDSLHTQEIELLEAKMGYALDFVTLSKALGG